MKKRKPQFFFVSNKLAKKLRDKTFLQSLLLLLTSAGVILVTLATNYFLTKMLNKSDFGSYSLVINIFIFSQVIFNFGFFYSLARLISTTNQEDVQKEYYGTGVLILFSSYLFALLCLFIFIWIFPPSSWELDFVTLLTRILPFVIVFLFINLSESILPAANKIGLLASSRFTPKLLFLLFLAYMFFSQKRSGTALYMLSIFLVFSLIVYVFICYKLSPKFKNIKKNIKVVWQTNKEFGFSVYLGSILAVGASSLSGILISLFCADNAEVGFFYIANQLAAPLALIPNIIATVSFRKFANAKKIDARLETYVFLISFISLVIIFLLGDFVITNLYGQNYRAAVSLLYILAFGSVLYGISDFYNRFLLSKGKGAELRNTSFIVGAVLLIADIVLIKIYGTRGAAIATVVAGICYLVVIRYYVSRQIRYLSDTNNTIIK